MMLMCAAAVASTSISKISYLGFAAFRMSDGRTQAVVVPALGAVLSYGFVGGNNWLMNITPQDIVHDPKPPFGWRNWGGHKTWLAPQTEWPVIVGRSWPPDPAWGDSNKPYSVINSSNGVVTIEGPVSLISGIRIVQQYSFDDAGAFTIGQKVEKLAGSPCFVSIWSDDGIRRPKFVYYIASPHRLYASSMYRWLTSRPQTPYKLQTFDNGLTAAAMNLPFQSKFGSNSPVSMIAAANGNELFEERAAKPDGDYPDGPPTAGCNVEVYDSGPKDNPYTELELLSPLRKYVIGSSYIQTVRWTLTKVSGVAEAAECIKHGM